AERFGDGRHAVGPVVVQKVDVVGAKARERRLERFADVLRRTVAALAHAELRREESVAAPALERLPDEAFALTAAVDVRRIDVRDAGVQRRVADLDAARAVEPASEVV